VIPLLILRPEPGASATAARAKAMGLDAMVRPLFHVVPCAWDAPDAGHFDCLVLTSANAARHAGPALETYAKLPVFTVGDATGAAAIAAGLTDIITTRGDAENLFADVQRLGFTRPLHLAGKDRTPYPALPFPITTRVVYASEPIDAALPDPPYVALVHSVRAAQRFAALVPDRAAIAMVTISDQVATAAGRGYRTVAVAPEPNDASMLALAAQLCESDADDA
jgi:uroporphyrinogen-III synthase